MDSLICPHCVSSVSKRAHVCAGCGAEIVRGATRAERRRVAAFFGFAAFVFGALYLGASQLPDPRSDAALFVILGFVAFVVVAALVGGVLARLLYSREPRFIREYPSR